MEDGNTSISYCTAALTLINLICLNFCEEINIEVKEEYKSNNSAVQQKSKRHDSEPIITQLSKGIYLRMFVTP